MRLPSTLLNLTLVPGAIWLTCAVAAGADSDLETVRAKVRARHPSVRHISTTQLAAWMADTNRLPPLLLDVRTEAEYAVSHLPGARRADPKASASQVTHALKPGRPLVAYCSVGYRSSQMAERLQESGVTNVFNLDGAIFQWANEGRPLEQGGNPTKRVHPYNKTFGKLLLEEYRAHVSPVKE